MLYYSCRWNDMTFKVYVMALLRKGVIKMKTNKKLMLGVLSALMVGATKIGRAHV